MNSLKDEKSLASLYTDSRSYVFTSNMCNPCKRLKEYISLHYNEFDTTFIYVNITQHLDLIKNMNIKSVPQTHVYKNGKKIGVVKGGNLETFSKELKIVLST